MKTLNFNKIIANLTLLTVIVTSCQANNLKESNQGNGDAKISQTLQNKISRGAIEITDGKVKNHNPEKVENIVTGEVSKTQKEEVIVQSIKELVYVNNSIAVISGNTAIIGITLDQDLQESKIVEIKRQIEKMIKSQYKEIIHVAITASPVLFERIIEIKENEDLKSPLPESSVLL